MNLVIVSLMLVIFSGYCKLLSSILIQTMLDVVYAAYFLLICLLFIVVQGIFQWVSMYTIVMILSTNSSYITKFELSFFKECFALVKQYFQFNSILLISCLIFGWYGLYYLQPHLRLWLKLCSLSQFMLKLRRHSGSLVCSCCYLERNYYYYCFDNL